MLEILYAIICFLGSLVFVTVCLPISCNNKVEEEEEKKIIVATPSPLEKLECPEEAEVGEGEDGPEDAEVMLELIEDKTPSDSVACMIESATAAFAITKDTNHDSMISLQKVFVTAPQPEMEESSYSTQGKPDVIVKENEDERKEDVPPKQSTGGMEIVITAPQPNGNVAEPLSRKASTVSSSETSSSSSSGSNEEKLDEAWLKRVFSKDKRLGKGNFGEVFKRIKIDETETDFPQELAVKQISIPDIEKDDKEKQMMSYFERERKILHRVQKVEHDNLVRLYASITGKFYFFLLLELCDENMKHFLKSREVGLEVVEVAFLGRQILNGLAYLHSIKIIHRDMKSENVLLNFSKADASIADITVKICDFGLSRLMPKMAHKTVALTAVGTEDYMAPEVAMAESMKKVPYKQNADIFSTGIILYEMKTKSLPFLMSELKERTGNMEKISAAIEDEELRDTLLKMLCWDPKQRPSAKEVLNHAIFLKKAKNQPGRTNSLLAAAPAVSKQVMMYDTAEGKRRRAVIFYNSKDLDDTVKLVKLFFEDRSFHVETVFVHPDNTAMAEATKMLKQKKKLKSNCLSLVFLPEVKTTHKSPTSSTGPTRWQSNLDLSTKSAESEMEKFLKQLEETRVSQTKPTLIFDFAKHFQLLKREQLPKHVLLHRKISVSLKTKVAKALKSNSVKQKSKLKMLKHVFDDIIVEHGVKTGNDDDRVINTLENDIMICHKNCQKHEPCYFQAY